MDEHPLGLGLVGAGEFGQFCLRAFEKLPGVRLVAVCDSHPARLANVARDFGLAAYASYSEMLADPAVEIVAVGTPPASHATLAIAAATAGKHVFCEKPLATSIADAEATLWAARESGVALTVDYVMRPNPLYRLLKRLAALRCGDGSPLLGELWRFALENFAADEKLGPDHWFWDERASGGIFVEHGVHFFDLFGWQLGRLPERITAQQTQRDRGYVDTVQAIAQYEGGATGSFYHAFKRAGAAEHQGITLGWDWATAELHGWIALDLHLNALVDDGGLAALAALLEEGGALLGVGSDQPLPEGRIECQITERFPSTRSMRGRGKERRATARVLLQATLGGQEAKMVVYEQCVRAGMADLVAAIREGQRTTLPEIDLWASTVVAVASREAAALGHVVAMPSPPSWLAG